MTTFTSEDREEAYKKILEAAPNQPGYEDAVPISVIEEIKALEKGLEFFKALNGNNSSPPHIVDSGASVMLKELTNEEIMTTYTEHSTYGDDQRLFIDVYGFARAILRKAQEK